MGVEFVDNLAFICLGMRVWRRRTGILCPQHLPVVGTDDKLLLIAITQWVVIAFYSATYGDNKCEYKTLSSRGDCT